MVHHPNLTTLMALRGTTKGTKESQNETFDAFVYCRDVEVDLQLKVDAVPIQF